MGRDKATLPFGTELMLQRVVRLIASSVPSANIAVVASPSQELPVLPQGVSVVRDAREYRGPLEGLATGLRELADRADAVYATACDVPLLVPAFVNRMFGLLGEFEAAVPFDGRHHPLAAVYRPSVLPRIQELLDADQLHMRLLLDVVQTREIPVEELRTVDPQLLTLRNLNREQDYRDALRAAGF